MRTIILTIIFCLPVVLSAQDMDFKKLKLILAKEATIIKEYEAAVEYEFNGVKLYLVTDEDHNRMRLMAGVVQADQLKENDMDTILKANFDSALDARYAISDNILWSVYIHPLKELQDKQVVDAFYQVWALVKNYGTTYNSTEIIFGDN